MNDKRGWILLVGILLILALAALAAVLVVRQALNATTQQILDPFQEANRNLQTQVSEILHPTPTVIPDPVTIIHDVRSLARLETIQYTVEKVITAEVGQGIFGRLFGDRLLFVAHGTVIAGLDLEKLTADDLWMDGSVLMVRLPAAEVFVSTLDNDKSYIYNRETGIFSHGDANLETTARQAAEQEILNAALDDGILAQAQANGETFLARLLRDLGYPEVRFITEGAEDEPLSAPATPTPQTTVAPPATITPTP
jgi:hypothetical protein